MRKLLAISGNIKMTTAIAALVLIAIIGSIAAVSGAIYLNLYSQSIADSRVQQETNLAVAATILERRISGSVLKWTPEGVMDAFQSWAVPPFYDTEIIDSVTRVTQQDASIYVLDAETQIQVGKTTSVAGADGARIADLTLDASSPAYALIMAGEPFVGQLPINGVNYFAALQPIEKMSGEVMGAIFVGTPMAHVEASANGVLNLILMVGGLVTVGLGLVGLLLSRMITKPIPKLASSMDAIAEGNYEIEVPYTEQGNEVGAMARAVEIFRENGLKVSQMTEEERAASERRRVDRTDMMVALQAAFGEVVDAAIAGDFSKRVHAQFPDPELNALAASVNNLVETVDRGLEETGQVLAALADTNLTMRMDGDYQGSFAKLKADTNAVADKLTDVVTQLRSTSRSLKTATGEILSGANDLSERTTKQAATIEETSAAMEQLASTVADNARMAEDADGKAQLVSQSAAQSGVTMSEANGAMERITSSSAKISNIIGMIDDIAFQTNLLALNASVEAARAGDAGKGFAVVAVEVRRLAQSAASASSDVKALIEQSANEVKGGSKLVSNASEQLTAMLQAVEENANLMQAISKASREQAAAIDEVSVAVRTLDEMTQHNAALVEETNAAIEQTEAQASELDRVVDIFTIEEVTEAQPRRAATPARDLVEKVRSTAKSYLTQGSAALAKDWSEF